ncbi:MAG: dTMP kinase [Deltaproteobacteria bacterium]|nr:dTMP kinase [Deltaproteobacteria bacterium]
MKYFITFEGIEGCGKTTQISFLKDFLKKKNRSVITTREPGGTKIGDKIRRILLDSENTDIDIKTELLLYQASRAQHVKDVIRPALEQGCVVLCDRFTDATSVYQGFVQGISEDFLERLNRFTTDNLTPNLTVLIDCPVEIGLKRTEDRTKTTNQEVCENRFEEKSVEFHQMVRLGYLQIAEHNSNRFHIVDGREDISAVHREIRTAVIKKMAG